MNNKHLKDGRQFILQLLDYMINHIVIIRLTVLVSAFIEVRNWDQLRFLWKEGLHFAHF